MTIAHGLRSYKSETVLSLPFFPLYPKDFEAKTSHLTLEEDGAYNRLLRLMWMTPGCTLPDDDVWIMRRMRCSEDAYERVVKVVIAEFFERKSGRIINPRMAKEYSSTSLAHAKRVEAGSKGGKAKALKQKESDPSNAKAMLKQPEPEPYSKREAKASPKKRGERLPDEWSLPSTWGNWAMDEGLDEFTVRSEASKFKDYWHSQPSSKGLKADWQATWRNWVRSAIERRASSQQKSNGVKNDRTQFDIAHREYARRIGSGEIHRGPDPSDPFAGGS